MCNWLGCSSWEIMYHPPYNLNLMPSNFHLSGHLQKHPVHKWFATDTNINKLSPLSQRHITPIFLCQDIILGMVKWCDKCLNVNGDYVEVPCVPSAIHVPRIHQNQNDVLGIRVYYLIFCNPFVLLEFNSICPSIHTKNLSHHDRLKWMKGTAVNCALMNVSYIYVMTTGVYNVGCYSSEQNTFVYSQMDGLLLVQPTLLHRGVLFLYHVSICTV